MSGAARLPLRMVWDDRDAVAQFDAQGRPDGANARVYRLNAAAISRLAPENGSVLDLGSGSGRMLGALAALRPDLNITGIELSKPMLELGRRQLTGKGIGRTVHLIEGDMLDFEHSAPRPVDVLSTVWTLEHFSDEQTRSLLERIAGFRRRTGCAIWIFDFARLPNPDIWPQALASFGLSEALLRDSIAAERAAFTIPELQLHLSAAGLDDLQTATDSGGLGVFQAHWAASRRQPSSANAHSHTAHAADTTTGGSELEAAFTGLPQQRISANQNQR